MEYNILMKVQTIKYLRTKMCLKNILLLTKRQLKVALRKNTNLENLAKDYLPQWQNLYFLLLPYVPVLRKTLLHMVLNLLVKDSVRFYVRVSVQEVKSLGGHFACLCWGFQFYEVKKNCYHFSKRKWKYFYTFYHFYSEKSSKRAK